MHPIPDATRPRFLSRWLPAIAWLVTFTLYSGMAAYLAASASRRIGVAWTSWLLLAALGLIAVASLVITVRAARDARSTADPGASGRPDWHATLPMTVLVPDSGRRDSPAGHVAARGVEATRAGSADASRPAATPATAIDLDEVDPETLPLLDSPLAEPLERRLAGMLDALEAAGVLEAGEAPLDAAVAAASASAGTAAAGRPFGLDELLAVLERLQVARGTAYARLALFPTRGEVSEQQIIQFVEDVARLAGRLPGLGAVELRGIGGGAVSAAPPGHAGPANAVVRFALDGRWHAVPFVMLAAFPLNLIEGLADRLAPDGGRRVFVEAWTEGLVAIACIDRDRLADLDAALAWNGETFGMVVPAPNRDFAPALPVKRSMASRAG